MAPASRKSSPQHLRATASPNRSPEASSASSMGSSWPLTPGLFRVRGPMASPSPPYLFLCLEDKHQDFSHSRVKLGRNRLSYFDRSIQGLSKWGALQDRDFVPACDLLDALRQQ